MNPAKRQSERGSVSTEFAVAMPFFLVTFVSLVVFAGRVAEAEHDVRSAAHEAARAASLTDRPTRATEAANTVARANLTTSGLSCSRGLRIDVAEGQLRPAGQVRVTVTCRTDLSDLSMLGVPGSRTFTGTAVEVVDTYRSDP